MPNKNNIIINRFVPLTLSILMCASVLSACGSQNSSASGASSEVKSVSGTVSGTASTVKTSTNSTASKVSVEYDSEDENSSWNSAEASNIVLNGSSITFSGTGATVDGSKITITSAGTYHISGTLTDGQIVVNTEDKKTVRLILDGANMTCSTSAPIYIKSAKKTIITLAAGTQNSITDGTSYLIEDAEANEPNAAIFCKSDLTVNGDGSLAVNANYNDGITCKDELKIVSGNITVNSAADGIRGRDYVAVKNAVVTVNAKGDGIKSNNDEDAEKGFVCIEGKTVNITAGTDAIQAETKVYISGGDITMTSGGGAANGATKTNNQPAMGNRGNMTATNITSTTSDSESKKGIKAVAGIIIDGGTIAIDSADDSVHSNGSIIINGGSITAASGDDGIHADATLDINSGEINISKSYEGLESAVITINDGSISVVSSDDGINVAGGNDSSSVNGRTGQNTFAASSNNYLNINGGYVVLDASGDGLDSNGSINITNGVVIVNGPTANDNGALDYNGTFKMTGGFLVAAGSSGMAQTPDTSSTQYAVSVGFSSNMSAKTMVHIQSDKGEDLLTFVPTKTYQSIVVCSPELKNGTTYHVYTGGSSTGTVKDGLYSGGTYSAGTEFTSFTISAIVTSAGSANNANRGMPGRK